MTQAYSTLRVTPGDDGVLGVVMDAPPMNLIGPELVRDLTKVAEYTADGIRTAKRVINRGPLELDLGDRLGTL